MFAGAEECGLSLFLLVVLGTEPGASSMLD